jgi:hypothetical protein
MPKENHQNRSISLCSDFICFFRDGLHEMRWSCSYLPIMTRSFRKSYSPLESGRWLTELIKLRHTIISYYTATFLTAHEVLQTLRGMGSITEIPGEPRAIGKPTVGEIIKYRYNRMRPLRRAAPSYMIYSNLGKERCDKVQCVSIYAI